MNDLQAEFRCEVDIALFQDPLESPPEVQRQFFTYEISWTAKKNKLSE